MLRQSNKATTGVLLIATRKKVIDFFYRKLGDKISDDVINFLINACILGYRKLILCMFNGDLQRKPTEYLGQNEKMQMKTTLWHILLGGQNYWGLESLVRFAVKLWKEFCLALIFPVSQPQGWELSKRGTQRKLAP